MMASPFQILAAADSTCSMLKLKVWRFGFFGFFSLNRVLLWTNLPFPLQAESREHLRANPLPPFPTLPTICPQAHRRSTQRQNGWFICFEFHQFPSFLPKNSSASCPLPSIPSLPTDAPSCSAGHSSVSQPWEWLHSISWTELCPERGAPTPAQPFPLKLTPSVCSKVLSLFYSCLK